MPAWMVEDPPAWLVVAGLVALVVLVMLFWRSRTSLSDLERRGDPRVKPRDLSARPGPRTRIREWLDPNTNRRPDE